MIEQNEFCRVWKGEDSRCRDYTLGAHWGCPVMWMQIKSPGPRAGENGLTLTRDQALEFAYVMECYGRTGELPVKITMEQRAEWREVAAALPLTMAEGGEAALTVVDGGLAGAGGEVE